jgi:hypothetical protein
MPEMYPVPIHTVPDGSDTAVEVVTPAARTASTECLVQSRLSAAVRSPFHCFAALQNLALGWPLAAGSPA